VRIDVASPDGNTYAALSIACRMLKQAGVPQAEIEALGKAVKSSRNAREARREITLATNGAIEFYNSADDAEETEGDDDENPIS
jgi:hypothetical protein